MTEGPGSLTNEWGRDSAGAPPKPGGKFEFRIPPSDLFPYGRVIEIPSFTCRHCGIANQVPPQLGLESVARCFICWGLVCSKCEPHGDCKEAGEFMKQVEASERRERLRAAAGCAE